MGKVFRHAIPVLLMPFMGVAGVPYWLLPTFAACDSRWSAGGFVPGLLQAVRSPAGSLADAPLDEEVFP